MDDIFDLDGYLAHEAEDVLRPLPTNDPALQATLDEEEGPPGSLTKDFSSPTKGSFSSPTKGFSSLTKGSPSPTKGSFPSLTKGFLSLAKPWPVRAPGVRVLKSKLLSPRTPRGPCRPRSSLVWKSWQITPTECRISFTTPWPFKASKLAFSGAW